MIAPGTYVEYLKDKKLVSAVCLRQDKPGRIFVRAQKGREEKLQENKAMFTVSGFISLSLPYDEIDAALNAAGSKREELAANLDLSELWELISDEPADKAWTLTELSELSLGEATPLELSAAYRALENDRIYFTRKGDSYLARSAEQVKDNLHSQQKEAEFKAEREAIGKWLETLWKRSRPCPELQLPELYQNAAQKTLDNLADVVLFSTDSHRYRDVQNLLTAIGLNKRNAPFTLLVKAGYWSEHENVLLHKLNISQEFSPEVEAEAALLGTNIELRADAKRLDLRDLHCVTIDDAATNDLDDAISYELLPTGNCRIGIHIADVSAVIPEGSLVDSEAFERSTSIYLPDLRISMVPEVMAHGQCSLVAGEDRLAFSFLAEFTPAGELASSQITPSLIKVSERLTYEDGSRYLSDGHWPGLNELVECLRQKRKERGASLVPFPRVQVKVSPDGEISVTKESPNDPAQKLVSEMMILANRLGAEALYSSNFPAIYRTQEPPEKPIEDMAEYDPALAYACKRYMHKGIMSTEDAPHSGLGLEHYIQVTSPIRRYNDLLMQRQLKSLVSGTEPHYSKERLQACLALTKTRTAQADQLEKDRRNYWLLRYLEKQERQAVEACVVANHPDKHIIQLSETLWETECSLVPKHPMPPGTRLWVRIDQVWPRDQTVNVSPIIDEDE
ncbi:MAG: ribonuclease R [bacterium]|nr:ribonuclease R [bacterium]